MNGSHLLEKFWVFVVVFVHSFLKSGIREGLGHAALSLCPPLGTTATLFLFLFIYFCSSSYAVWLLKKIRS